MKRILRLISAAALGRGIGAHRVRANVNDNMGAAKKRMLFEVRGWMGSLINNLTPSAIG